MKRYLVTTFGALAVSAVVGLVVIARGGDAGLEIGAVPSLLPSILRNDQTAADAPAWPPESNLGLKPKESGGTPSSCDQTRNGGHWVDPALGHPWTLEALTERNQYIAIVTAESQRSWWRRPQPGEAYAEQDVVPTTTTNYRVERVLKGSLPSVVQSDQFGARKDGTFPCSAWAYDIGNDPLPEVGTTYVLFIEKSLGAGRFKTLFGSAAHLPIVDGVVYSLRDVNAHSDISIHMKPEPLEQFITRFE